MADEAKLPPPGELALGRPRLDFKRSFCYRADNGPVSTSSSACRASSRLCKAHRAASRSCSTVQHSGDASLHLRRLAAALGLPGSVRSAGPGPCVGADGLPRGSAGAGGAGHGACHGLPGRAGKSEAVTPSKNQLQLSQMIFVSTLEY